MKRVSVDASVTDLFFRKSLLLHKSVLNGPDSNPFWRKFSVAGQDHGATRRMERPSKGRSFSGHVSYSYTIKKSPAVIARLVPTVAKWTEPPAALPLLS